MDGRTAKALLAALLVSGCIIVVPVPLPGPPRPAGVGAGLGPATATLADPGSPPAAARCPQAPGAAEAEARVLAEIAAARAARGLGPIAPSPRLRAVAQGHACDNAARGANGHEGSDGSDLVLRLARGGYRHGVAAENTGRGFSGPAQAVAFWLASPRHAANLLHPALREAGLGLARGADGRPYWVLVLAEPR